MRLITGGAGFIGSNLADRLIGRGEAVRILDDLSRPGSRRNLDRLRRRHGDALEVMEADVADAATVERAMDRVDAVFHLAGQVAVTLSVADPRRDFEANALGTLNVLEAVRRCAPRATVLYSSTNKVYGNLGGRAVRGSASRLELPDLPHGVSETQPLDFHSPYGCSKGVGDQYCLDYARIFGLDTVVFRQSCVYGCHQHALEAQGWVAWLARRTLAGEPITLFGDGRQVRDVLWIDDLLEAFDLATATLETVRGRAYNLGGGPSNTLSLLELLDLLEELTGRRSEIRFAEPRPGDQSVYVSDIRAATRDLGWTPKVGVREGVERLLAWLHEGGA